MNELLNKCFNITNLMYLSTCLLSILPPSLSHIHVVVAFHGLQLKIKKEPHSPCSELGSTCGQERPFKLHYGEKCLYNIR